MYHSVQVTLNWEIPQFLLVYQVPVEDLQSPDVSANKRADKKIFFRGQALRKANLKVVRDCFTASTINVTRTSSIHHLNLNNKV